MMSNNNDIAFKQATKDDNQGSGGGRKTSSSQRPPEQTLRCPRCDSTNTKFCYYNNYNLTQPRYFCKTCRRYWTKGGTLRNIPIGGGCRKNKKTKSCSSKFIVGGGDHSSSSSISSAAVMDFQLGGINYPHRGINQFSSSSYGQNTQNNLPFMSLDPLGFHQNQTGVDVLPNFQQPGNFTNNSLTSSIQSLSSLNQDLHWKLQQQRLALLFGGGGGGGGTGGGSGEDNHHRQQHGKESGLQPILFHNLEASRKETTTTATNDSGDVGGLATEWFFDNSYAPVSVNPTTGGSDQNGNVNVNSWNGFQAWNDHVNHYNSIP